MSKYIFAMITGLIVAMTSYGNCSRAAAPLHWKNDSGYLLIYAETDHVEFIDLVSCQLYTDRKDYDLYEAGYIDVRPSSCNYYVKSFRLYKDGSNELRFYDNSVLDWIEIPNISQIDMSTAKYFGKYPFETYMFNLIYKIMHCETI